LCRFPGVKRPKHGVNHCRPSSVEFKSLWSYTSIPADAFVVDLPLRMKKGRCSVGPGGLAREG
jgi:hypothetical protein